MGYIRRRSYDQNNSSYQQDSSYASSANLPMYNSARAANDRSHATCKGTCATHGICTCK